MENKRVIIIISIAILVLVLIVTAVVIIVDQNNNGEDYLSNIQANVEENLAEENNFVNEEIVKETLPEVSGKGIIVEERSLYRDENNEAAVIPAGYAVVKDSGNIEDGLVISDVLDDDMENSKAGNQFVWVPVDIPVLDARNYKTETEINTAIQESVNNGEYPMAIRVTNDNYAGVLYSFQAIRENTTIQVIPFTYGAVATQKEPSNLDSSLDNSNNITDWTNTTYQEDFNEMIEKISNDKGFWIARFETSVNENGMAQSKKMQDVVTNVSWFDLYEKEKTLKTLTTKSHMIWGCQWDQVMIWLKDLRNQYNNAFAILDSTGLGNYADLELIDETGNVIKEEGVSIRYKAGEVTNAVIKNIYDLAGNVFEWTMESYYTSLREARGGYCAFDGATYPLSSRYAFRPDYQGEYLMNIGSRMTIY